MKITTLYLGLIVYMLVWFLPKNLVPYQNSIIRSENISIGEQFKPTVETFDVAINDVPFIEKSKIEEAFLFSKKQKLDTNLFFFIDMKIHSGKKRFFIYDYCKKEIIYSGLCCHGMGLGSTCEKPIYSNVKGSNCTSLGKYKTGERSYSNWGINIHYKMHGLENTNSNAFSRIVVLHSYDPVPDLEIYPEHLPMGWSLGCPVISNQLMTSIDTLLKNRKKSVLLWIYK